MALPSGERSIHVTVRCPSVCPVDRQQRRRAAGSSAAELSSASRQRHTVVRGRRVDVDLYSCICITQNKKLSAKYKASNPRKGWLGSRVVAGLRRSRAWVQIAVATLSGNCLRQTVHTHRASVHQAAKPVSALLRVARVTAGLVGSNGSIPPSLQADCHEEPGSAPEPYAWQSTTVYLYLFLIHESP